MTVRTVTISPPEPVGARWASFQLEALDRAGDWSPVQAGQVDGRGPLSVTARFPEGTEAWRVLWVAEGGSINGLERSAPHDFNDTRQGRTATYRGR